MKLLLPAIRFFNLLRSWALRHRQLPSLRIGIRPLLIGGMALVIVMLMTVTTLIDIDRQRSTERKDLEERGYLLANSLRDLLVQPLRSGDSRLLAPYASALWGQADIWFVKIFDADARYLIGPGEDQFQEVGVRDRSVLEKVADRKTVHNWSSDGLEIFAPVGRGELVGVVHFGFDTARIDDEIAALTRNRIWQTVALVGAGVALSYIVASYITEPIRVLRRATHRLARGELNTRIRGVRGLEMQELGASFNYMAGELEEKVEALEESRARIVSAQENVRRELAMHLHGPVQGQLLGLKAQLENLAHGDGVSAETAAAFEEIIDNMGQVIQHEISSLSRRLYPAIVRRGIVPALQSLCDQVEPLLEVELDMPEGFVSMERLNPNLIPEETRLATYRIVEEALTNVIKHSYASKVRLSLEIQPDTLLIRINDNGRGFDATDGPSGLGLSVMYDYAEANNGACSVESSPGAGTVVTARMPISIELVSPVNGANGASAKAAEAKRRV